MEEIGLNKIKAITRPTGLYVRNTVVLTHDELLFLESLLTQISKYLHDEEELQKTQDIIYKVREAFYLTKIEYNKNMNRKVLL